MTKSDPYGITPEMLNAYQDVKKRYENGEEIDKESIEAIKALELANQVMNTIMSGGQVDPIFLKKIAEIAEGRLMPSEAIKEKKVLKKKRFKRAK